MKKSNFLMLAFLTVFTSAVFAQQVNFIADTVCLGTFTHLVADTTDFKDSVILSVSWDLDNDGQFIDGYGRQIIYTFTDAGSYPVSLKIETPNAVYAMLSSKNVVIYPVPNANFQVDNLCEGQEAVYRDQSTISSGSITKYYWDFDNNGVDDDNTSGAVARRNWPAANSYTTRLTVFSNKNCSSFATKTAKVFNTPQANFNFQGTCLKDTTEFLNTTTLINDQIDIYVWNFGDGIHEVSAGDMTHIYANAQNYSASLIAISKNNCRDTLKDVNININPIPDLTLQYNDTILRNGGQIQIMAQGSFNQIHWSNGANTPMISVSDSGNYIAEVTNPFGCTATSGVHIYKTGTSGNDTSGITIRSKILTPNGDGINDYFIINNLASYQHCKVSIYNIYGELVLDEDVYKNNWNGSNLDPGSYFYVIVADNKTKKGTINILR